MHPGGGKHAKQLKRNGGVRAYKEESIAMVDVKIDFAAKQKEEKMNSFDEVKAMKKEKWKAKGRNRG